jgi:EAL domain-containing protein (putative c-di-GMP-specific phosphodiesterase class I)
VIGPRRGGSHAQWSDDVEENGVIDISSLISIFAIGPALADHEFILGCDDDGPKRAACRKLLGLANGFGARDVAEVDNRDDFVAALDLGFDLTQGFCSEKAMGKWQVRGPCVERRRE